MKIACVIAAWLMLFANAHSAEVRLVSVKENDNYTSTDPNCNIVLSGVIDKGDAKRLSAVISENLIDSDRMRKVFFPVICMNSPGGSFTEAIKIISIIDDLAIGTMVRNGDKCESACALAFMAGNYPEEGNTYPWRMMHPGASVGFHAPDLTLAPGQYNERDVARAYQVALQTVSQTIEKLVMESIDGNRRMAPSLLAAMLATPADQMHRVDTVDKAGRWGITIVSVGREKQLSDQSLVRACANMRAWNVDESAYSFGEPLHLNAERGSDFSYENLSDGRIRILFFGMYVEGCEFSIPANSKTLGGKKVMISAVDDIGSVDHFGLVDASVFHDPRTKITDLQ
ncbi:MAG: hypothetical protein AB3N20_20635 [Rhizobiaceae bacterium]